MGTGTTRTSSPSEPRADVAGDTAAVRGGAGGPDSGELAGTPPRLSAGAAAAGGDWTAGAAGAAEAAGGADAAGAAGTAGAAGAAGAARAIGAGVTAVTLGISPTRTRSSDGSRPPPWRSIVTPKMSGDQVALGGETRSVPAPWASTRSSPAETRFPRLMLPSHSWYVRPVGGWGRPETTSTPPPMGSHESCPRAPLADPTGTSGITRAPAVTGGPPGSVRAV
jgi:hypothetical protein